MLKAESIVFTDDHGTDVIKSWVGESCLLFGELGLRPGTVYLEISSNGLPLIVEVNGQVVFTTEKEDG